MSELEYCFKCDEPTGCAGRADDSHYNEDGEGPFCWNCWCQDMNPRLEELVEQLQAENDELVKRIQKMYAGDLSPESRLAGYKVIVKATKKRQDQLQAKLKEWDYREWPFQTHLRAKTKEKHLEQIRCLFGKELFAELETKNEEIGRLKETLKNIVGMVDHGLKPYIEQGMSHDAMRVADGIAEQALESEVK